MNLFIIPSWYPSDDFPSTGIFFKEQATILAKNRPEWKVGLCLWGSHEPLLWLKPSSPLESLLKRFSRLPLKTRDQALLPNCVEFFTPAFTWMRRFAGGNMEGIVKACDENLSRHIAYFGKPDVLVAQVAHPGGYIAWRLAQKHKIPFVVIEHMSPFPMPSYRGDYKKWLLPPLKAANLVLAVSDHLKSRLEQFGVSASLTSNFIDDEYWHFPKNLDQKEGFILVAVGRLTDQKNYPLMLRAMAELKRRELAFQLSILGNGEELSSLKKLSKQLHIDDAVIFHGECERSDVKQHFQESTIFLNTSKHENQPVAMLEAMACGLPVLTTDWLGASDMIDEDLGLVMPIDAIKIADAIEQLMLKNPFRRETVRDAYERKFGTKQAIARLENQLKNLL